MSRTVIDTREPYIANYCVVFKIRLGIPDAIIQPGSDEIRSWASGLVVEKPTRLEARIEYTKAAHLNEDKPFVSDLKERNARKIKSRESR